MLENISTTKLNFIQETTNKAQDSLGALPSCYLDKAGEISVILRKSMGQNDTFYFGTPLNKTLTSVSTSENLNNIETFIRWQKLNTHLDDYTHNDNVLVVSDIKNSTFKFTIPTPESADDIIHSFCKNVMNPLKNTGYLIANYDSHSFLKITALPTNDNHWLVIRYNSTTTPIDAVFVNGSDLLGENRNITLGFLKLLTDNTTITNSKYRTARAAD